MSSVPLVPIQRLIHDVTGDLHVVVAASEQGFRETALEACLLAEEKLHAIREELLRPEPGIADPRYGDDRLQKMSTGSVRPESFTHGSSQQRMRWFNTGLNNENIAACNTSSRQSKTTA